MPVNPNLYPGARWRGPIPNKTTNGMGKPRMVILHIQDGTEVGTDAWFHNREAEASAHFGNPKAHDAKMDQWVAYPDKAWAEAGGNPYCLSVENEGRSGDSLTDGQVERLAHLLVWCKERYGIRMRICNHPNSLLGGLGYHGMGGVAWGNHPDCPGKPIIKQRKQILRRARTIRRTHKR